jgi:predicted HD phosphohydrolase
MMTSPHDLIACLQQDGEAWYEQEPITHIQHALQCAWLADQADEDPALIVACLFHDIGLLIDDPHMGDDECPYVDHDLISVSVLRNFVSEDVLAPIRLHSTARRYLASHEEDYLSLASPSALREINMHGGPLCDSQAFVFRCMPGAEAALRLCRYDDHARSENRHTPDLSYFLPLCERMFARARRVRTEIPA